MSIEYPEYVQCPNCKNSINLDYSKTTAYTSDLISIKVEIPQSSKSGSDATKNKQNIDPVGHYLLICNHCKVIIGAIPGDFYLHSNSSS